MTGAITVASVLAEREDLQPTGEAYVDLAVTGATVAATPPHWRREVATFLAGLLNRVPLVEGALYEAHRAILGSLILDLETSAITDALDGAIPPDLRDPATIARELGLVEETRAWAEAERLTRAEAYHAHVGEILATSAQAHAEADDRLAAAVAAAPDQEVDDALPWSL